MAKKSKCSPNMTYVLCAVIVLLIVYLLYNNYKESFQLSQSDKAILKAAELIKKEQKEKENQEKNENQSEEEGGVEFKKEQKKKDITKDN